MNEPDPDRWTKMLRFGKRGSLLPAVIGNIIDAYKGVPVEVHHRHGAIGVELSVRDGSDTLAWIPFDEGHANPEQTYVWLTGLGLSCSLTMGAAWTLEDIRLAGGGVCGVTPEQILASRERVAGAAQVVTINPGGKEPKAKVKPTAALPQLDLF